MGARLDADAEEQTDLCDDGNGHDFAGRGGCAGEEHPDDEDGEAGRPARAEE